MNARVVITVGGWFDSLSAVSQADIQRLVSHNAKKYGWQVQFADQRGSVEFNEV